MTQADQVVQAIQQSGGIATLADINRLVDVSKWRGRTPYASIRRAVQYEAKQGGRLRKIKPGLYCLREKYAGYRSQYDETSDSHGTRIRNHTLFQSILVDLGRHRGFDVFVPAQDRNREYMPGKTLEHLSAIDSLPNFGHEILMSEARTVDVVWMNRRNMPAAWYEVEMTTDMIRSLQKFHELQDFHAAMHIVAPKARERELHGKLKKDIFYDIRKRVNFQSTEKLMTIYQSMKAIGV